MASSNYRIEMKALEGFDRGEVPPGDCLASGDYDDDYITLGHFGAPKCRCTNSVVSLVAMMIGLVLFVSGLSLVIFFNEENLIIAPGATLGVLGGLLVLAGICSWSSECLCADLARSLIDRFEEAPAKNAQKRRRRRAINHNQNLVWWQKQFPVPVKTNHTTCVLPKQFGEPFGFRDSEYRIQRGSHHRPSRASHSILKRLA